MMSCHLKRVDLTAWTIMSMGVCHTRPWDPGKGPGRAGSGISISAGVVLAPSSMMTSVQNAEEDVVTEEPGVRHAEGVDEPAIEESFV